MQPPLRFLNVLEVLQNIVGFYFNASLYTSLTQVKKFHLIIN